MKSLWQQHCERWAKGCGSSECAGARNVVLARGSLPCDVLFVGEAPGESEDVLGRPFCGPAGKLLDDILHRVVPTHVRYAMTNLVGCIPREAPYAVDFEGTKRGGGKATEPLPEQIEACQPRLSELIELASPRLIICVGALAKLWIARDLPGQINFKKALKPSYFIPVVDVTHPAAVLRADPVWKGIMVQKIEVEIQSALEEYVLDAQA